MKIQLIAERHGIAQNIRTEKGFQKSINTAPGIH